MKHNPVQIHRESTREVEQASFTEVAYLGFALALPRFFGWVDRQFSVLRAGCEIQILQNLGENEPSAGLLFSLDLSDTQVHGPYLRALLRSASHFYAEVVLRTSPGSPTGVTEYT